ncbi:MAG: type II CRISPR RNA-guided endonuclease Cas9 [Sedimentisphaerales bacterium]|nr:type II CRISPR RNA-guided endonuclease Cas9 [Sedimentisphaerales bacterium]
MFSTTLGLDIGSNSVGSAWIDLKRKSIKMGVSVFPAGIEESDTKRGAPKNQARRDKRTSRKIIKRRTKRKHEMRKFLLDNGWMPEDCCAEKKWLEDNNPWLLRRDGLKRELKPQELGRILLHMAQRRGAFGFGLDEEDENAGKIKDAINHTRKAIKDANAQTFGELMAIQYEQRRIQVGNKGKFVGQRVRNRRNANGEDIYEFCTDRELLWQEFDELWNRQKSYNSDLAKQLTDECRRKLDNPEGDRTWRYKGILFGQRKAYWDVGTLARCDLEPTDMKCPKADMYAQEFLVLETVNNIRITPRGELKRPLSSEERAKVISVLNKQKTGSVATVRKALGLDKGQKKTDYTLSLENDEDRGLNTNWFSREIVGAIGIEEWANMPKIETESVNRAVLKFDPQIIKDVESLKEGCRNWWALNDQQIDRFIEAWKKRPKVDNRINYSRRAIKNLLPYMREGWTVNEARQRFVEDAENGASDPQRERYSFEVGLGNRRQRQYIMKHSDLLPPAPDNLSNPVVRKAIHEVRRHLQAYMRQCGCKPDRIVVELAREARQSAIVRNKQLARNRAREKERKNVIEEIKKYVDWYNLSKTQQAKAVKRVLLSKEQRYHCAYCDGDTITEKIAAAGESVELDHITPQSRGGDNGLNNLVVCHTKCNRGKGNNTPIEWLTEEAFGQLELRLGHLKKDNKTKWDNLHKKVPDLDGFVESQLTDTAYASRQVVNWLRDVMYSDKEDNKRRVFTTKGRYTSILRQDWGLFPDRKDDSYEGDKKNRADHRHHAIDATVIALSGPERLSSLAKTAEMQEIARSEGYASPKREAVRTPWGDFHSFRMDVMKEYDNLVVAHRPEGRKIKGSLHNDTLYGAVVDEQNNLTKYASIKKPIAELSPKHLRVPNGWKKMLKELKTANSVVLRKKIRKEMLALKDVAPGKSGVVRDRWFRQELRECLQTNGIDPDMYTEKQLKDLLKSKDIVLNSGVPIRRFTLLRAPTVKPILRKRWNPKTGKMEYDENNRSVRLYEPQNNHHIEIREDKKGKWKYEVVTNYDAAQRVRPPKASGLRPQTAVNREDTKDGKFVMSLSIGETVYMKHPETRKPDFFVVFKIDGNGLIHFTPHHDAGRAKETETCQTREDIKLPGKLTGGLTVAQLQILGVEKNKSPQKVWVGPLGDIKPLIRD